MERNDMYEKARARAEAKLGFYIHLPIFLIVSILLVTINLLSPVEYLWFKWPVMGWGIGVIFHALTVFVFYGRESIPDRMIRREMERLA